jgi:hypothetical protein
MVRMTLEMAAREGFSPQWAAISMVVPGDRVLGESATAYSNALTLFTASSTPIEWATTQFGVARLYLLRAKFHEGLSRSTYKSDLQKGKAYIDAAFTIMNQEAFPKIWDEAQRTANELETKLRALGVSVPLTARQSA